MKTQITRIEHTNIHAQASRTHHGVIVSRGRDLLEEYTFASTYRHMRRKEAQTLARKMQKIYGGKIIIKRECRGVQYQHEI